MNRGPQRLRIALLLSIPIALAACGAPAAPVGALSRAAPVVVLLSLDGTRAQEVEKLGSFRRIAGRGLAVRSLQPVFPTNTFPNHVSLVTGVNPERHGIVNNSFRDPERGSFRYENDPSWIEVEPLWSILARADIPSAAFHWVGSEGAWRTGKGPAHWRRFESGVPEADKVRQIIAWLEEAPEGRPRLITAWFRGADSAGHRAGPDSAATRRVLTRQDEAIATLLDFLERGDRFDDTTLLLVSDHGMAPVTRRVDLAAAIKASGVRATLRGGGGFGTVSLHRGDKRPRAERIATLLATARGLGLEAWPRGERENPVPDAHPRFGDVVVMAPLGTGIARAKGIPGQIAKSALKGSHGYAPDHPAMQAMIAAVGRGVPAGATLEGPRAIDVAPTILALLGVPPPEWMDGSPLEFESGGPSGE